ncbi:MAG: hypothetical protein UY15_C0040G0007 [Parcubacteria group bacterium GW2011_GWA2_47_9]|nr:MAG: hypothetical protein UY15_C0040G0007 [Parcubacteria group bacterium GW2011_GWA2_47_9]
MAKKEVAAIVSGAGWIADFTVQLVANLKARGCTAEEIHSLVTTDAKPAIDKIADEVASFIGRIKNIFRVVVDCGQTLAQMIAAGKYNRVNSDITNANFPIIGSGKKNVAVELVHFNRSIESNEAIRELDRMGMRPATIEELLAFGAKYPEVQREFPILALGSVWRYRSSDRYIPCLYRVGSERYLDLGWIGSGWHGICRFAAVRK